MDNDGPLDVDGELEGNSLGWPLLEGANEGRVLIVGDMEGILVSVGIDEGATDFVGDTDGCLLGDTVGEKLGTTLPDGKLDGPTLCEGDIEGVSDSVHLPVYP